MNRLFRTLLVLVPLATVASAADAACFFMYDAKNALVYQSSTSPVDLSRPVSEQMAMRYPARALVIATTTVCGDDTNVAGPASRFISNVDVANPYAADSTVTTSRRSTTRRR